MAISGLCVYGSRGWCSSKPQLFIRPLLGHSCRKLAHTIYAPLMDLLQPCTFMVAVVALNTTLKDSREEEGWRPEQCHMQKKQGEIWLECGVGFEGVKNKHIHQSVIGRANVMGKVQKYRRLLLNTIRWVVGTVYFYDSYINPAQPCVSIEREVWGYRTCIDSFSITYIAKSKMTMENRCDGRGMERWQIWSYETINVWVNQVQEDIQTCVENHHVLPASWQLLKAPEKPFGGQLHMEVSQWQSGRPQHCPCSGISAFSITLSWKKMLIARVLPYHFTVISVSVIPKYLWMTKNDPAVIPWLNENCSKKKRRWVVTSGTCALHLRNWILSLKGKPLERKKRSLNLLVVHHGFKATALEMKKTM